MNPFLTDYVLFHLINYGIAVVIYTMFGQVVLGLFIGHQSEFFMMRFFRTITNPFIKFFSPFTPSIIVPLFVPLYVAFWLFLFRLAFGLLMLSLEMAPRMGQMAQ